MPEASPSIVSHEFDSDTVPSADRVDLWRHGLISTHVVQLDERVPFHALCRVWKVGDFVLTGGTMTPQTLRRPSDLIRRDQIDHYGLFTVGSGARIAIIDGAETRIQPGDLQIFDFSQRETSVFLGGQTTTLYLPRDLIDGLIPGFSRFHGTVLRDTRAQMLARHLVSLHRYLGEIGEAEAESLADLTMTFAIDTLTQHLSPGSGDHPQTIVQRAEIVAYVRAHLTDPELSPATILTRFPLSRSSLFRLFERDGGVERFIRAERLRAARACMLDQHDVRPIEQIALTFGFSSGSSLTRAFRETYGLTPAEVRADASTHLQDTSPDRTPGPSIRDLILA
ncbi:MAG: helix-turn-helix domain-containing protein [Thermomicrobiales bacterium]